MGNRAARMAGNSPPIKPITPDAASPVKANGRVGPADNEFIDGRSKHSPRDDFHFGADLGSLRAEAAKYRRHFGSIIALVQLEQTQGFGADQGLPVFGMSDPLARFAPPQLRLW
jgi:hypothetical protein